MFEIVPNASPKQEFKRLLKQYRNSPQKDANPVFVYIWKEGALEQKLWMNELLHTAMLLNDDVTVVHAAREASTYRQKEAIFYLESRKRRDLANIVRAMCGQVLKKEATPPKKEEVVDKQTHYRTPAPRTVVPDSPFEIAQSRFRRNWKARTLYLKKYFSSYIVLGSQIKKLCSGLVTTIKKVLIKK